MGDLQPGLLNLANWVGNVVLPISAGLILAGGIYQFSKGQELERYVYGALGALMGSGLLRLAEVISQQATDADQYMVMLLTLTNFVGNVLLPFYAAIEIVRLVLGLGGVFRTLIRRRRLAATPVGGHGSANGFRTAAPAGTFRSGGLKGRTMALNSSPVSRNLHLKVTILFLELEDLLAIMLAVSGMMLIGNFLFSDFAISSTCP